MDYSYEADKKAAHIKLDSIYSELFAQIENEILPFQELSEEIFRKKNELTSLILKGALNYELNKIEEIRKPCPICKRIVTRHRQKSNMLQSINGYFLFRRGYFYCRICKYGFCPADQELEIIPRKLQFDIQWRALELAVRMPFEEATKDLKNHYNVQFDKKILHRLVKEVAENATIQTVTKNVEEIRKILKELRKGSKRRIVVVIGIDGAYVPVRPDHQDRKGRRGKGYWREAKGIRLYAIAEKRIYHILSWHQLQDADKVKECLNNILEKEIIPQDEARVCVCADGAEWIWNRVKQVFPNARLVLDYYHCSEHLHQFANIYFGQGDSIDKMKWLTDAKEDLFSGRVMNLVVTLRKMATHGNEAIEDIILDFEQCNMKSQTDCLTHCLRCRI